jgi:hypothetical protein
MVGWRFLTSKVGMTTLVRVSCILVAPRRLWILERRNLPSYFGPLSSINVLTTSGHGLRDPSIISERN